MSQLFKIYKMNVAKLRRFMLSRNINIRSIASKNETSAEYCLKSVKKHDYENFICMLLLQNTSRSSAFAIRSFNVEVARVAEQVSQEAIGLMRLQFWEDTVEKCLSNDVKLVPKHPVAIELYKANIASKLTKRYLNTLILSRKEYVKLTGFNTLQDMEKYAERTVSNVHYLVLEACGVKNVNADHAASHLGKAQGIVQQLRSIPHAKRLNFLPVPQDILLKNKVSQEEVLRAKVGDRFNECIFEIASRAHQHLVKARSLVENVPKEGRAALLPAVPVYIYLDRLQKCHYNVFHKDLQERSWKLLPQLWFTNFKNKY